MAEEALIRAIVPQKCVEIIAKRRAIYDKVSEAVHDSILAIADTRSSDWISMAHHNAVQCEVRRLLGDEQFRAYWREINLTMFEQSIFRGVIDATVKLLDPGPKASLKMTPRAYSIICHRAGKLEFIPSIKHNEGVLKFSAWPKRDYDIHTHSQGFAGAFEAFAISWGRDPRPVVVGESATGAVTFHISWGEQVHAIRWDRG